MPIYAFHCDQCEKDFETLCSYQESQDYHCEDCGGSVSKLLTCCNISFTEPKSTSKWDNFGYRAGWNMNKAKDERRAAEAQAKGVQPYRHMDDTSLPGVFGKDGVDPKK